MSMPEPQENLNGIYQTIFRRALYLLGNRTAAEDAAQEAFYRYLSRRPAALANPTAWLMTVVTRLCFDWLRRERHVAPGPPAERAEAVDTRPLPEEALTHREDLDRVRAALDALEPRDRMVLLLRHSGEPYRVIAEQAGCAENSVGQILHRAERRFQAAYERLAHHGPSPR